MKRARRMRRQDYQLLAAFRRQIRIFFAFSEQVAEATGLPTHQYQALLAIKGHVGEGRMTVGELAKDLMVEQPGASAMVDRLVAKALLVRIPDERDRRRILLALTPEAEEMLSAMATTHLEELRRMQPTLTALVEQFGPSSSAPEAVSPPVAEAMEPGKPSKLLTADGQRRRARKG